MLIDFIRLHGEVQIRKKEKKGGEEEVGAITQKS